MKTITLAVVLVVATAVSLFVWLRNRWRKYPTRRGDQNELDCLEEMAGTYTCSGYPSREYIERCIREAEANIEPSRLRDVYVQIAREALEAGPKSGSGLVIKAD
jgi:hypothetical protein